MSSLITDKIARLLTDKDTEKRRQGAMEIEQKVKQLATEKKKDVRAFVISCSQASSIIILRTFTSS
jgi:hypothetical protein